MKPRVQVYDASAEYYFDEGCFINELSNTPEDPALSIARARLAPGETTRWHYLVDVTERYVLLQGGGRVEVQGMSVQTVAEGDVVLIPPGARQRIHNSGSDDLVFLAICSPPFTPAAYVDVEDEGTL